jgi:hypothetical protein
MPCYEICAETSFSARHGGCSVPQRKRLANELLFPLRLRPYLKQILMNTTFAKLLRGLLGNRHHITIYFATGDGQFVG